MKQRTVISKIKIFGIIVAGILIANASASCSPQPKKERPMNFLVIMADDVSADMYGCYGNKKANTPNIDKLAENGILFTTCWAAPICSPSRAMIMTGSYAHRTGWYHNALRVPDENGGVDFQKNFHTFPALLKSGGYATAIGGKWQLPGEMTSPEGGFDEYCIWEPGAEILPAGFAFNGLKENDNTLARYWYPSIVKNGALVPTTEKDFGPDIVTAFLIDFIKRNKDVPFLAYYPMILPHGTRTGRTTTPLSGKTGDHTNGTYQENVDYTDVLVGRLVRTLEELDLMDNTLIIFTSDNPMPNKNRATDKGATVPLVMHCPKIISENHISDELVSLADILPTLTDFAGIDLPAGYEIDGISLLPYLRGETDTHREWLLSYVGTARMIRDKRWVLEAVDPWCKSASGRLYDCANGDRIEITGGMNEEAQKARKHFEEILSLYPSPDTNDNRVKDILKKYDVYFFKHKLE